MMYVVRVKDFRGKDVPNAVRIYSLCTWYKETSMNVGLEKREYIPAWSLHRIIEMMPKEFFHESKQWHLFLSLCYEDAISYEECDSSEPCYLHFCSSDNIYDNIIESIEWLIKEGYFNKEYLN